MGIKKSHCATVSIRLEDKSKRDPGDIVRGNSTEEISSVKYSMGVGRCLLGWAERMLILGLNEGERINGVTICH